MDDVGVINSAPPFDDAAIKAVREWHFVRRGHRARLFRLMCTSSSGDSECRWHNSSFPASGGWLLAIGGCSAAL